MNVRAEHTRTLLQSALLELASERPVEEISVSEIVDRAGVNRSSFYQHYDDKHTLLADALERTIDEIVPKDPAATDVPVGQVPVELWRYLEHISEHASVYRQVFSAHGSAPVVARLTSRIEAELRGVIDSHFTISDSVPSRIRTASAVGGLIGVITAWIADDPLPPVDVAAEWIRATLIVHADSWLLPNHTMNRTAGP